MSNQDAAVPGANANTAQRGRERPRYFVLSGDVKAVSLQRLRYFQRLEVYHVYQRTRRRMKADDTSAEDFAGHHYHAPTPFHVLWHLFRAKPDIVQGPEPFSILMFMYLLPIYFYLLLYPSVKLVVNSLEPIPLERKYTSFVATPMRWVLRRYFQRASIIFWFVPGVEAGYHAAGAPRDRIVQHVYADWGVDLDVHHPEGEAETAWADRPVVLFLGRLVPEKGVHHLIEAFERLRAAGHAAQLVIVGDGPERERLQQQAGATDYAADIAFTGLVPQRVVPRYYRAASVMVAPFLSSRLWIAQWDNVFMEAMACGLPIIAADSPQNREVVGTHAGIFVKEGDVDGYAEALTQVLTDETRRQEMSRAARAEAERRFDPDRNAASAERLILRATGFDDAA